MKKQLFQKKLLFRWQPKKDSNPHKQSQSLSCYLYTIRLYSFIFVLATCILYYGMRPVSSAFFRKNLFFCRSQNSGRIWLVCCYVFLRGMDKMGLQSKETRFLLETSFLFHAPVMVEISGIEPLTS